MKESLYALSRKIIRPITENLVFFVALAVLLVLPAVLYGYRSNDWVYVLCALLANIVLAYLLSALCVVFVRARWLQFLLVAIMGTFSFLESFLAYSFGTLITATLLQMVLETNPNEVSGFVNTYLLTGQTILFVSAMAVGAIGLFCCFRWLKGGKLNVDNLVLSLSLSVVILGAMGVYVFRDVRNLYWYMRLDSHQIFEARSNAFYSANYTTIGGLLFNILLTMKQYDEIEILEETMRVPLVVNTSSEKVDIVLIIGESFNRYHSSLYAYEIQTNPQLAMHLVQGRLSVFTDVVTPYNYTHDALRSILSFYSQEIARKWNWTPLFPFIYKVAGFECFFISNQEVKGEDNWGFDFLNSFLVSDNVASMLFDYQNGAKREYDLDIVRCAEELDKEVPQFWLYHLMGQHTAYSDRYPAEEKVFAQSDYAYRSDLTDAQKEIVAHYDNATRYNDKVVAAILDQFRDKDAIVIYLSDHGEEVYDYRDHMGRSHEPIVTPERAKYQFEVPFMIWMSDKYKENHPDVVAQVERSVDRPFMIDDLPHLMLDLAGIECEWFDPTRSVINDQFNEKRKRLLLDSKQDYDVIMGRRND